MSPPWPGSSPCRTLLSQGTAIHRDAALFSAELGPLTHLTDQASYTPHRPGRLEGGAHFSVNAANTHVPGNMCSTISCSHRPARTGSHGAPQQQATSGTTKGHRGSNPRQRATHQSQLPGRDSIQWPQPLGRSCPSGQTSYQLPDHSPPPHLSVSPSDWAEPRILACRSSAQISVGVKFKNCVEVLLP